MSDRETVAAHHARQKNCWSVFSNGKSTMSFKLCSPPAPAYYVLVRAYVFLPQAVQAAQLTFEDFFMADLAMAPLKIVGFEGVFGSLMMLGVLLPAAYFLPGPEGYGLHENTLDTLAMIKSSKGLQVGRFW